MSQSTIIEQLLAGVFVRSEAWLFAVLAAGLSVWLGFRYPHSFLFPLWNTLFIYPLFYGGFLSGKRKSLMRFMLLWALALLSSTTMMTYFRRDVAAETIIHGPQYHQEITSWIRTGYSEQTQPSKFIPYTLKELSIFIVISFISGSFTSLYFGCIIMNYTAYTLADLLKHATDPLTVGVMGVAIWDILRIISYIVMSVVLAEPSLAWVTGTRFHRRGFVFWLIIGFSGLGLSLALRTLLAPHWRLALLQATNY